MTAIGKSFGIARTTITSILKSREKYKQLFFESETDVSKKPVRPAKFKVSHLFF